MEHFAMRLGTFFWLVNCAKVKRRVKLMICVWVKNLQLWPC